MQTSFLPIMRVPHYRRTGFNTAGEPIFANSSLIGIAPVRLKSSTQQTSIRADTSGSQSRASERAFDGRILVHPSHTVRMDDQVEINSRRYTVEEVEPRFDMAGLLHHYQVDLAL